MAEERDLFILNYADNIIHLSFPPKGRYGTFRA